ANDLLEHPDRLSCHIVVVERLVGIGSTTMPPAIEGDDAVALGETVDQRFQSVAVRQAAMHDKDRLVTRPVLIHPRRMAVDLDSLAHHAHLKAAQGSYFT